MAYPEKDYYGDMYGLTRKTVSSAGRREKTQREIDMALYPGLRARAGQEAENYRAGLGEARALRQEGRADEGIQMRKQIADIQAKQMKIAGRQQAVSGLVQGAKLGEDVVKWWKPEYTQTAVSAGKTSYDFLRSILGFV